MRGQACERAGVWGRGDPHWHVRALNCGRGWQHPSPCQMAALTLAAPTARCGGQLRIRVHGVPSNPSCGDCGVDANAGVACAACRRAVRARSSARWLCRSDHSSKRACHSLQRNLGAAGGDQLCLPDGAPTLCGRIPMLSAAGVSAEPRRLPIAVQTAAALRAARGWTSHRLGSRPAWLWFRFGRMRSMRPWRVKHKWRDIRRSAVRLGPAVVAILNCVNPKR